MSKRRDPRTIVEETPDWVTIGTRVHATDTLIRTTESHDYPGPDRRVWVTAAENGKGHRPVDGVIVGIRTLSDGKLVPSGDYSTAYITEHPFKAVWIATSVDKRPVYARLADVTPTPVPAAVPEGATAVHGRVEAVDLVPTEGGAPIVAVRLDDDRTPIGGGPVTITWDEVPR